MLNEAMITAAISLCILETQQTAPNNNCW